MMFFLGSPVFMHLCIYFFKLTLNFFCTNTGNLKNSNHNTESTLSLHKHKGDTIAVEQLYLKSPGKPRPYIMVVVVPPMVALKVRNSAKKKLASKPNSRNLAYLTIEVPPAATLQAHMLSFLLQLKLCQDAPAVPKES